MWGRCRPLNLRPVRIGSNGPRTTLMRILMTNACTFNCHYCPMRRDRDMPRTLLKPAELVRIFLAAVEREWCTGLFLTTGIPGRPVKVMDDLIEVLTLLREKHRFTGYIHVKMVPGAEVAQIERLTSLATRISMNLEAPCGDTLARIAPEKNLSSAIVQLERVRGQVNERRNEEREGRPRDLLRPGGVAGMTMQFVVGATPDTDRTILGKVTRAVRQSRHSPHALRCLSSHSQHAARERARNAGGARATAVSNRLSLARLRLRAERGRVRCRRESSARERSEDVVGARTPGALSDGGAHRVARAAAARAGDRPGERAAHRDGAREHDCSGISRTCARWASSPLVRQAFSHSADAACRTCGGRSSSVSGAPDEEVGAYHIQYDVSPGTFR